MKCGHYERIWSDEGNISVGEKNNRGNLSAGLI
jgi:hypothetical protein